MLRNSTIEIIDIGVFEHVGHVAYNQFIIHCSKTRSVKCGLYPRVSALRVAILCARDGDLGKGPVLTTVVLYIKVFSLNLRVHVTSVKKEGNLNRLFAFFSGNKTKFECLSSDVQESLKG